MVFDYPIDTSKLRNDKLRLVPLEDNFSAYTQEYIKNVKDHPELHRYTGYGPFSSVSEYTQWYEGRIAHSPQEMVFAIILAAGTVTKKKQTAAGGETEEFSVAEGTMAGTLGICNATAKHSSAEIAHILIFPRFQRTFVGTNANALLLRYLLEPVVPSNGAGISGGGLQLRRVQWQANVENKPSIAAAERLGFRLEGIARWQLVLSAAKEGLEPEGMPRVDAHGRAMGPGRHSAMLALCWDEWIEHGRQHIDELLKR